MIDQIRINDSKNDPFASFYDEELGGWRFGYDNAWRMDVDEGDQLVILSQNRGWYNVEVVDAKKGFILKPLEGDKSSPSLYVIPRG